MFESSDLSEGETRARWNTYIESYCTWAEQWESALLDNRRIVAEWQAEQDTPYPVYRLTYAVAPADWSADEKTERATIWSLTPMPNPNGYWSVIENCHAVERYYRMWVTDPLHAVVVRLGIHRGIQFVCGGDRETRTKRKTARKCRAVRAACFPPGSNRSCDGVIVQRHALS